MITPVIIIKMFFCYNNGRLITAPIKCMKFFIPLLVTENSVIKRKGAINKTSSPHLLQARIRIRAYIIVLFLTF